MGRGDGEVVANTEECAAICDDVSDCISYEFSPNTGKCSVNDNPNHSNENYQDQSLCQNCN